MDRRILVRADGRIAGFWCALTDGSPDSGRWRGKEAGDFESPTSNRANAVPVCDGADSKARHRRV
jgi:hypothetical protein